VKNLFQKDLGTLDAAFFLVDKLTMITLPGNGQWTAFFTFCNLREIALEEIGIMASVCTSDTGE
jgi:hypothetical protein